MLSSVHMIVQICVCRFFAAVCVCVCVADQRGGLRLWPDQIKLAVQSREQRSGGDAQP